MKNTILQLLLLLFMSCGAEDRHTPQIQDFPVTIDGKSWVATSEGLYVTNEKGELIQMPLPSLTHHPFPSIHALHHDSVRGRLWIGAWNHLYCYDLLKKRFITIADSSIYRTVDIKCDSLGRVLVCTERGLFRMTLADSLPEGRAEQMDNKYYSKKELSERDKGKWSFKQKEQNYLPWLLTVFCIILLGLFIVFQRRNRKRKNNVILNKNNTEETWNIVTPTELSGKPSFIEKAQQVVDAHLANEDFSPEMFAQEMAVSRAQLFRKIKNATKGQTVMEFITERRLKQAVKLLTATDRTMLDIATVCGFGDAITFRRAFIRRFGTTPSQYREEQNKFRKIDVENQPALSED